ncbi:MAG: GNAT family N-acetyltransferase [Ginsengibacter sp.]
MNSIKIIDYESKHQSYFEKFNRFWIEKYFHMEDLDEFVLTNPEEAILKPGGAVLMALYDEAVAGTVALRKVDNTTYEFTKMAVEENFQRKGIAETLSYASFKKAKELGAREVILYTNSILKPAIHLYEKIGFRHVSLGIGEYKRSDVKMTIKITQEIIVNPV